MGDKRIPAKMRKDFEALTLSLKFGMQLEDDVKARLITFIQQHLPEPSTSRFKNKLQHYLLANEFLKKEYKTKANSQEDGSKSAFLVAAKQPGVSCGEKTVEKHYYEIKKVLSEMPLEANVVQAPSDYSGPQIFIQGGYRKENILITTDAVYFFDPKSKSSKKLRDLSEEDLSILNKTIEITTSGSDLPS